MSLTDDRTDGSLSRYLEHEDGASNCRVEGLRLILHRDANPTPSQLDCVRSRALRFPANDEGQPRPQIHFPHRPSPHVGEIDL